MKDIDLGPHATTPLRAVPEMPSMPVGNLPFEEWREQNESRLLRYFRDLDPDGWDRMTRMAFSVRKLREERFELGSNLL